MKLNSKQRPKLVGASLLLLSLFAANSVAQKGETPALDSKVRAEIAPFKGKVFLFAQNLDTGQTYSFNGDERVRTASTIKIAVMIEAFARVADGRAKWTDELVLTKAARYAGSGILQAQMGSLPVQRVNLPALCVWARRERVVSQSCSQSCQSVTAVSGCWRLRATKPGKAGRPVGSPVG